jgi:tetratricopeptide (TPR) repeat protein
MAPGEVDWGPALAVLTVAVVLGAIAIARLRRSPAVPLDAVHEREDLLGQRDVLMRRLHELDLTSAGREGAADFESRYSLELEAARLWQRLDALGQGQVSGTKKKKHVDPPPVSVPAEPPPPAVSASPLRGFLWGIGSAAALGLLLFTVSREAGVREEGGSVTGTAGATETPAGSRDSGSPSAPEDAELQALRQSVAEHPDDLDARLALAQQHLGRQDLMAVFEQTQYVLEREPEHPRALAYQSLVRLAMGQAEMAVEMLQTALRVEPDYLEGYVHLALVYTRVGETEKAEAAIAEAVRRHPSEAELLDRLLGDIRAAAEEAGPLPEADTHPGVAPRPARAAAASAAPASSGAARTSTDGYAGLIRLDPAWLGEIPAGAVIFLSVREAGYTSGAPNAAKRLPVGSLPMSFEVRAGDSMMGGDLPDTARIEARIDSDGNVMTRDPADPVAVLDDVPIGTATIELVLSAPK